MKVLILSTYQATGGAAIAASRLTHALKNNGIEATMLCRKNLSWWHGKPQSWSSIIERGMIWASNGFSTKGLWDTDWGLLGQDITKTKEYKEADVIHLHYVQQGFISLSCIEKMIQDGKRIVWTMHDEWALDTIHHYTYNPVKPCHWIERKKKTLYASGKITFVTCSEWLKRLSEVKPLAQGQHIVSIPNPIDSELFKPIQGKERNDILFVAQNVNDERKGIKYLNEAAAILKKRGNGISVKALGRDIPYIYNIKEMAELYASFKCFVTPSLQDNLPNTIMEAMSCGTPCVGFNVGGIPEMIDHKQNGYVANYKDAEDLANGIEYVLANQEILSAMAREKVLNTYNEKVVAERYINIYNENFFY